MGACISNIASASTIVSAGPDTLHACFMVCLKVDLYQSKYANMPITFSMKPCPPGKGYVDKAYGEGTVFSGFNAMARPEQVVVSEIVPLKKVVLTSGATTMTYTMTALPNDKCQLEFEMVGTNLGMFQRQVALQTNTMKHFIEANVGPICNDAPPIGREISTTLPVSASEAAPTTKPAAFCGNCGKANSKTAFCTGCGVPNGGAATGGDPPQGGFVEIPQHAEAKQATLNLFQKSQTKAIITASRQHARIY